MTGRCDEAEFLLPLPGVDYFPGTPCPEVFYSSNTPETKTFSCLIPDHFRSNGSFTGTRVTEA